MIKYILITIFIIGLTGCSNLSFEYNPETNTFKREFDSRICFKQLPDNLCGVYHIKEEAKKIEDK